MRPTSNDHPPGRRPRHSEFDPTQPRGRSRRRSGRVRRGEVRAAVLALLTERPMHGYEIIQELSDRTGGVWQPSPGAIYPTLQLLQDKGLITGEGRTPWAEVAQGRDPGALHLRATYHQVGTALRQVTRAGSTEQQARANEVLTQARRQLYLILADTQ
jgi:DNA-binding PadR family transcriptional regulator